MCLVAQVVGAPVQCSEGCEQHNLAISLSVHFPMAVCLTFSVCFVLCSFDFFCMPVLLDYLVSQVVSVPDHILDTLKFSKYLGLALDPASTLYPQNIRNIRHTQNIFELKRPQKHFPNLNIDLKKPQIDRNDPPKRTKK